MQTKTRFISPVKVKRKNSQAVLRKCLQAISGNDMIFTEKGNWKRNVTFSFWPLVNGWRTHDESCTTKTRKLSLHSHKGHNRTWAEVSQYQHIPIHVNSPITVCGSAWGIKANTHDLNKKRKKEYTDGPLYKPALLPGSALIWETQQLPVDCTWWTMITQVTMKDGTHVASHYRRYS